jgi:CMP-N-acetylneuraminic acid synthetase
MGMIANEWEGQLRVKVVAFVPMKMNNERLPGKNERLLGGKVPLYSQILQSLAKVESIDEIFVYCSEDQVVGLQSSIRYLKRDTSLDSPETSILEVMESFARNVQADIYLLAHATAPFLSSSSLEKVIDAVKSKEFDSSLTVLATKEFIWENGRPQNYDVSQIPRTQDMNPIFVETTGAYAYTSAVIAQGRRVGERPFLVEVSKIEAIDINDSEDWEIADALYRVRAASE